MKITIDDFGEKIEQSRSPIKSFFCYTSIWRFLAIVCTLCLVTVVLALCKAYIRSVLLWLEDQDSLMISVTICFLYILVALPVSVGYIVLVVAGGYLFGVIHGLLLAIVGANFGLLIAHNIIKLVGHHNAVHRLTENETAKAIMRVISGPLCFKIVFCSRLTPIPFGLQNTIFALSNVSSKVYHLATLLGLFPAQFVAVYVGSTLRSMQDVLENRHISPATYIFVIAQLIFGAGLMVWFGNKARKELLKALAEADSKCSPGEKAPISSGVGSYNLV